MRSLNFWVLPAVFLAALLNAAKAGDWPAFRGPDGNGISVEKNVPTEWGPKKNIKWRFKLPGMGNSSPIVSNGRVFLTCATEQGSKRSLFCFDRKSGEALWVKSVEFNGNEATHKTNPYAGSSPVANGKRVVVWHGNAGLFCYDFAGKELWQQNPGSVQHTWGYGSSPIIHGQKIIMNVGPGAETALVALDLNSGDILWKTDEPGGANDRDDRGDGLNPGYIGSWSTPVVTKVEGEDQIVCIMPTRVVGYEPEDGQIIWSCDGMPSPRGNLVYTSPIISSDLCVALGGFKGPALAFKMGGVGDITKSNRLWREAEKQPQRIGSGVILGDHLFTANAGPGTAQCIEVKTGKIVWENRLGGDCWGSLISVNGLLYVTDQNGTTTVFKPSTEKFDLVADNRLNEPSNATPAFSDGEIFIRTDQAIYCISEK